MKTLKPPTRIQAILLAFLITVIWATSWVLIKIGLKDIPALTFAGLRYSLAFVCLLPFLLRKTVRDQIRSLSKHDWMMLVLLGLIVYALAQGGQFLGLSFLPAVTVSLVLNMTSLFVAFFGIFTIKEYPTWTQWCGVVLNLLGIFLYFFPGGLHNGSIVGYLFAGISLAANIAGALLGRSINRETRISPIVVTMISMGIGSILMLGGGIAWQGLPQLSAQSVWIIILLAVVNTAFAFTIWNYTIQTLTAMESSIINSTMLVQVAILVWFFIGEKQTIQGIIGLTLAFIGALIVNIKFGKSRVPAAGEAM